MSNPTIDLLLSHRSVRRFQNRPLPDGVLETLIRCGQQASTSSNLQAYTVIHVADPKRKKRLAELCADQVQIHQSAAFLAFCADLHRDRMANRMHDAERFDGDYAEALMIATVDVALMMQNVAIAAESLGLGICMIGAMRNNPKSVGRLLDLPPYVVAVAGFCIGYPDAGACKSNRVCPSTRSFTASDTCATRRISWPWRNTTRPWSSSMPRRGCTRAIERWTKVMAGPHRTVSRPRRTG